MKHLFATLIGLIILCPLMAQDIIIKKTGEEIKGKVKAISQKEIEYVKADTTDKVLYKISKSEVVVILYSNGMKEIIKDETPSPAAATPTTSPAPANGGRVFYARDFFNSRTPITFLGIDFSSCKLDHSIENPKSLFREINDLITLEKSKYDVAGALKKYPHFVSYEFTAVNRKNDVADEKKLMAPSLNLSSSGLQEIVSSYDLSSGYPKEGLAFVIIAESLDKLKNAGTYYVVVFDIASKKILMSEVLSGQPFGKGPRNYWARTVLNVLNHFRTYTYIRWKFMYGNS